MSSKTWKEVVNNKQTKHKWLTIRELLFVHGLLKCQTSKFWRKHNVEKLKDCIRSEEINSFQNNFEVLQYLWRLFFSKLEENNISLLLSVFLLNNPTNTNSFSLLFRFSVFFWRSDGRQHQKTSSKRRHRIPWSDWYQRMLYPIRTELWEDLDKNSREPHLRCSIMWWAWKIVLFRYC